MTRRARACFTALLFAGAVLYQPAWLAAQNQTSNFALPPHEIEERLRSEPFEILDWRGSRAPDDRTQRASMLFPDSFVLAAKWASAPRGGSRFNNEPRYEVAAYELQKLFLDEADYVVPPTVIRAFPLSFVTTQIPEQRVTFDQAPGSVVVTLQYWLNFVTQEDFWQPDRVRSDSLYARRIANFNILTYLISHRDSNTGNYLISLLEDPRVYSVDNGVSFESLSSNRGEVWRDMLVDRLPRSTVDRLAMITREDLERVLGIVAEFEIRDGELVPVPPGENMSRNRGVRVSDTRVQFGLTTREIRALERRLNQLVRDANGRRYRIF